MSIKIIKKPLITSLLVISPAMAQAATEVPVVQGGLFGPVIRAFFAAGDSLGTAFPSSHCAGSVAAALLVGRLFGPAAGRLAGLWAAFIVVSTVYTNNHYLTDTVAGVATGLVIQKLLAVNAARNGVRDAGSVMQVSGSGLELAAPAVRKQGS